MVRSAVFILFFFLVRDVSCRKQKVFSYWKISKLKCKLRCVDNKGTVAEGLTMSYNTASGKTRALFFLRAIYSCCQCLLLAVKLLISCHSHCYLSCRPTTEVFCHLKTVDHCCDSSTVEIKDIVKHTEELKKKRRGNRQIISEKSWMIGQIEVGDIRVEHREC